MSKQSRFFQCAAVALVVAAAGPSQAHGRSETGSQAPYSLLTAFSPGPDGRYCGSVALPGDACLQSLGAGATSGSASAPKVTGEFFVGKMVDSQGSWHSAGRNYEHGSWQDIEDGSGHDMGKWLSHGRHEHQGDPDSNSHGWGDQLNSPPACATTPVPLPASVWMLASVLFAGVLLRNRRPFATQM